MGEATRQEPTYIKYTSVAGYFLQDEPSTDPFSFDYTKSFGLIERNYDTDSSLDSPHEKTQWQRFAHHVAVQSGDAGVNTQYKVLFMGRHGEGYHNVAEAFYGTAAWDCYWSHLDGNDTSTWSDAHLTPTGIADAAVAAQTWLTQVSQHAMPLPQSLYSSPLTRCLQTAFHTFAPLARAYPATIPHIIIKELFREGLGVHTCDRRSTKTQIAGLCNRFDTDVAFPFEHGFRERDELWDSELRETDVGLDRRAIAMLDDVFKSDTNTWISISSHSGLIASLLRVLGHRAFSLRTGAVIGILVKAEVVPGIAPPIDGEPFKRETMCKPPLLK